jgi:hypothetical protein
MFEEVVGKTVKAQYKRANRESVEVAIEVTAKLALPTSRGKVAYLFGTRMDAEKAGVIGLFRADCFRPSSVVVEDAPNFKPIEGYAEGEWYATTGNMSFGYPERVAVKDLEWALEAGAKPLMDFAVA